MKKCKYMTIRQVNGEFIRDKPAYSVFDDRKNELIGRITWNAPQPRYIFSTTKFVGVFSIEMLSDILEFINKKTEANQLEQIRKLTIIEKGSQVGYSQHAPVNIIVTKHQLRDIVALIYKLSVHRSKTGKVHESISHIILDNALNAVDEIFLKNDLPSRKYS